MTGATGLRRFAQRAAAAPAAAGAGQAAGDQAEAGQAAAVPARCEMCATPVRAEHDHVADLATASLLCACRACYLLFAGQSETRYRAVPDRYLTDPGRPMRAADLEQLDIPVGLAFFLRSSRDGELRGFYPGPAGVTQCELDLGRWDQLVADYPLLGAPATDVEAALVSRTTASDSDGSADYFLVPIDACYELAGRMRVSWRGFDGGTEARDAIAAFLARVRQRARPYDGQPAGA